MDLIFESQEALDAWRELTPTEQRQKLIDMLQFMDRETPTLWVTLPMRTEPEGEEDVGWGWTMSGEEER